jgi:hypothetical protein
VPPAPVRGAGRIGKGLTYAAAGFVCMRLVASAPAVVRWRGEMEYGIRRASGEAVAVAAGIGVSAGKEGDMGRSGGKTGGGGKRVVLM